MTAMNRRAALAGLLGGGLALAPRRAMAQPAPAVLNFRDFGAAGDGVTDDTAAWLAFCAAPGARRYIPKGRYVVTALQQLPMGVIEGDGPGASMLWQPQDSSVVVWGTLQGRTTIRDLTFVATPHLGELHRLETAPQAERITLDNVTVMGFPQGYGLCLGNRCRQVRVLGSHLEAGFWGVTIVDAHDVFIGAGTTLRTTGNRAVVEIEPNAHYAHTIQIADCIIDGLGGAQFAFNIWGNGAGTGIGTVLISQNQVRSCARGVQVFDCGRSLITGNHFEWSVGQLLTNAGGPWPVWFGNFHNGGPA